SPLAKLMVAPEVASAACTAARSELVPLSLRLLTTRVLRKVRSSSTSRRRPKRGVSQLGKRRCFLRCHRGVWNETSRCHSTVHSLLVHLLGENWSALREK